MTIATSALSRREVLQVAAWSEVDPRTVLAYLAGRRVRRASANAIASALRKIGCDALVRAEAA